MELGSFSLSSQLMPTIIERIKNDPRVSSVWDEGEDGWWCNLKTNWICDLTECGTCHEDTPEMLLDALDSCRLRRYEHEGGEMSDGCHFNPDYVPFVRAKGRFLKLSPFQAFVLADRPDDCLWEHLREAVEDGDLPHLTEDQIISAVESVKALFRYSDGKGYCGYLASTIDTYKLTIHQRYILEDCFSGSTVCGSVAHLMDSDDAKERALHFSAKRAVHIIARKFSEVGLESSFIPDL